MYKSLFIWRGAIDSCNLTWPPNYNALFYWQTSFRLKAVCDSLWKDSLPNGLIILLPKCQKTLCRNRVSVNSLMLATFEWLIDVNRSHSLVLKRVLLWKCYISLFLQCKTLNLVISTNCPSINCPSVKSLSTKRHSTISRKFDC